LPQLEATWRELKNRRHRQSSPIFQSPQLITTKMAEFIDQDDADIVKIRKRPVYRQRLGLDDLNDDELRRRYRLIKSASSTLLIRGETS